MEGVIETPCLVCGATTRTGLHYGAITCYPCRAFFRLLALAFDWCCLSSFKRSRVNHPSICSTTTRTLKIAFFTLPSQSFEKNLTKRWWPRTGKYEHREAAFPKKRVGKRASFGAQYIWEPGLHTIRIWLEHLSQCSAVVFLCEPLFPECPCGFVCIYRSGGIRELICTILYYLELPHAISCPQL